MFVLGLYTQITDAGCAHPRRLRSTAARYQRSSSSALKTFLPAPPRAGGSQQAEGHRAGGCSQRASVGPLSAASENQCENVMNVERFFPMGLCLLGEGSVCKNKGGDTTTRTEIETAGSGKDLGFWLWPPSEPAAASSTLR